MYLLNLSQCLITTSGQVPRAEPQRLQASGFRRRTDDEPFAFEFVFCQRQNAFDHRDRNPCKDSRLMVTFTNFATYFVCLFCEIAYGKPKSGYACFSSPTDCEISSPVAPHDDIYARVHRYTSVVAPRKGKYRACPFLPVVYITGTPRPVADLCACISITCAQLRRRGPWCRGLVLF